MELQPDYKELLASFNANEVEYLIVGAYALGFYGSSQVILICTCDPTSENVVLKFPDREKAEAFWTDPDYQPLKAARHAIGAY